MSVVSEARATLADSHPDKGIATSTLRAWSDLADPVAPLGPGLVVNVLYFALVLILALFAKTWPYSVLPSLAPNSPTNALNGLWSVQAAITAIGFPLLVLVIEFTQPRGMNAVREAEVLAKACRLLQGVVFALGALITTGILSIWLASDASVVLALALLLIPTVLFLAFGYIQTYRLLLSPTDLKRRGIELMKEKMSRSAREFRVVQRANDILRKHLAPWLETPDPMGLNLQTVVSRAHVGGRITDVDPQPLIEMLDHLSTGARPVQPGQTPLMTQIRIQVHAEIGSWLGTGDPLVAVEVSSDTELEDELFNDAVNRAFKIE